MLSCLEQIQSPGAVLLSTVHTNLSQLLGTHSAMEWTWNRYDVSKVIPNGCRPYFLCSFSRECAVGRVDCFDCYVSTFSEEDQLSCHELYVPRFNLIFKISHCLSRLYRMKTRNLNLGQHVLRWTAYASNLWPTPLNLLSFHCPHGSLEYLCPIEI